MNTDNLSLSQEIKDGKLVDKDHAPNAMQTNSPLLRRPVILGDLTLSSPTTFTTIGANGAASALTANPVGYLVINLGNTSVQIPYYTIA